MRAVNLIPGDQRRGAGGIAGRTGGAVYVILVALVALVAIGVLYAITVHKVAQRKTALAAVTEQVGAVSAQVAQLQPYQAYDALSQQRTQAIATLAAQRFNWPLAMQQIALALPSNVRLTTFGGTAQGGGAAVGASGASGTTGTVGSGDAALDGTIVNAPTLSVTGCAAGNQYQAQVRVASTLSRLRKLGDLASAELSGYSYATCDTLPGATFEMTLIYTNAYGLPSKPIRPGRNSTAGG
jgi:Tfp pilus assembly protein PilN